MLKKASASLGLVIAATIGAPLTSSPAYAHATLVQGWHHHSSHHSRNRNWNGNRHRARIFIRIYVINRNNNRAQAVVARPERRRVQPTLVVPQAAPIARPAQNAVDPEISGLFD